jgi:CRP-like cAMP-binding protein
LQCHKCGGEFCLKNVPMFSSLSDDDLQKIASRMVHQYYKKGQDILSQGKTPRGITIICQGRAKAYRLSKDGAEKILYLFSEHDYIGEQYLFANKRSAFTVTAMEDVKAAYFSKKQFQELLTAFPQMALRLIEELGKRTISLENILQTGGIRKTEARIAAMLMDFGRKYGVLSKPGLEIHLPMSREGMANYLGMARETLSRKLSALENEGVIQSLGNKKILIVKPDVLKKSAEEERDFP